MIVYTTSRNWDALYDLRKQSSDEDLPSHVGAARKETKQNKTISETHSSNNNAPIRVPLHHIF